MVDNSKDVCRIHILNETQQKARKPEEQIQGSSKDIFIIQIMGITNLLLYLINIRPLLSIHLWQRDVTAKGRINTAEAFSNAIIHKNMYEL